MGMQIDVAELAGIIIEGILYGMFVILTALSLYILLSRSRRGGAKVNKPMVVTSLLMFALATSQVIVDCIAMFDPFIKMTRPERIAEFKNNSLPINASKHGIFFTMMLLGDAIVVCCQKKKNLFLTLPSRFLTHLSCCVDLPMFHHLGKEMAGHRTPRSTLRGQWSHRIHDRLGLRAPG
jgi:hypothetical protein